MQASAVQSDRHRELFRSAASIGLVAGGIAVFHLVLLAVFLQGAWWNFFDLAALVASPAAGFLLTAALLSPFAGGRRGKVMVILAAPILLLGALGYLRALIGNRTGVPEEYEPNITVLVLPIFQLMVLLIVFLLCLLGLVWLRRRDRATVSLLTAEVSTGDQIGR